MQEEIYVMAPQVEGHRPASILLTSIVLIDIQFQRRFLYSFNTYERVQRLLVKLFCQSPPS